MIIVVQWITVLCASTGVQWDSGKFFIGIVSICRSLETPA